MKIISKYKDYYDYLQGIYGIDNKIVLDRTKGRVIYPATFDDYYSKSIISICGLTYDVAVDEKGNAYVGKTLLHIPNIKINKEKTTVYIKDFFNSRTAYMLAPYKTNINEELKCPIIYGRDIVFPRLSDFNIQKVLSAEKIYYMLYTWIESHKIINSNDTRTDSEKILSAGFDLKTSFRKIK